MIYKTRVDIRNYCFFFRSQNRVMVCTYDYSFSNTNFFLLTGITSLFSTFYYVFFTGKNDFLSLWKDFTIAILCETTSPSLSNPAVAKRIFPYPRMKRKIVQPFTVVIDNSIRTRYSISCPCACKHCCYTGITGKITANMPGIASCSLPVFIPAMINSMIKLTRSRITDAIRRIVSLVSMQKGFKV